jgi:hypothetical protein
LEGVRKGWTTAIGSTVLKPGDHVYAVAQPEDKPLIQLMFGRPEAEQVQELQTALTIRGRTRASALTALLVAVLSVSCMPAQVGDRCPGK